MLLVFAFAPFSVPFLGAIALVPLAWAVGHDPGGRGAATAGAFWALCFFGLELRWIASALAPVTSLHWLAFVAVVAVLALLGSGLGVAARRLADIGIARPLAFATAFTGFEWLRGHLGPLAFPWLGLGSSLGSTPAWMSPAAWVGERGLTFALAALSGGVAAAIAGFGPDPRPSTPPTEPRARRRRLMIGIAVAAGLVAVLGRTFTQHSAEPAAEIHIAVVTTAFGASGQLSAEDRLLWIEAVLDEARASGPLDVAAVLLPEGALPIPLERRGDLVRRLAELSARAEAPILLGAYGTSNDTFYNSTFLIGEDGILDRSDKRHRVAIVESGFGRGSPGVLAAGGVGFGPLVCFESLFADVSRDLVGAGADVLVNPTSESWFLNGGDWAAAQHAEHLRSRAIETGRPIVRAANDGESLVVDANGRIRGRSSAIGVRRVSVDLRTNLTLFVRWGDVVGLVCGLAVLALLVGPTLLRVTSRPRTGVSRR